MTNFRSNAGTLDLHDDDQDRATLTETLFRCLADCTNPTEADYLRDQVVRINMGVAESLARRYFGHGENADDLTQVAYLGLTKAVDGFDSDRGHNFLSYAVPTITGELKRHFRDHCWAVRPPRRVQDLQRDISAARQEIAQEHHREASVAEVAESLNVDEAEVVEALAAQGCFTPSSLDSALTSDSDTTLADMMTSDDNDLDQAETHVLLATAISELPEVDRQILALRFFEDWTQEQIARRMGTSQMQISRQLSRLMTQLQARIGPMPHVA